MPYNCGNPMDFLTESERIEIRDFNRKLKKYIMSLEAQRKQLKENKERDIESKLDRSSSPSDEEYFRNDALLVKAFPYK